MKKITTLAILVASLCATLARGAERVQVCATEGQGKSYKVQATLTTGQELNSATHSFDYNGFSKYVVIFWQDNQASVIEMDYPGLSSYGVDGKDQQGRHWSVSSNTAYCF